MFATREEISQCRFEKWYHLFIGKTFKSKIIRLTPEFVDYLGEDGVVLPESSKHYFGSDALSDDEDDNLREVEAEVASRHDFSDLDQHIAAAIRELEGDVMVKLNWSCPLDATWANAGTLKCKSASDIYMLLKSSDRIAFDLDHMYDLCPVDSTATAAESSIQAVYAAAAGTVVTPVGGGLARDEAVLVVRKWANLNPAMEFRVFVHNKQVVGICQRDCSTYYDFLEAKMDEVQDLIYAFFYGDDNSTVKTTGNNDSANNGNAEGQEAQSGEKSAKKASFSVAGTFPLSSYVMDVYVDNRRRVWIEDFNPFGEPTCSLLFEWDELLTAGSVHADNVVAEAASDDLHANDLKVMSDCVEENSAEHNAAEAFNSTATVTTVFNRRPLPITAPMYDFCEFRIIEDAASTLQSTKGSTRGPIDVHAASEFNSFMKLCKAQHGQESDSDSS